MISRPLPAETSSVKPVLRRLFQLLLAPIAQPDRWRFEKEATVVWVIFAGDRPNPV
jgi:hypothetical protein